MSKKPIRLADQQTNPKATRYEIDADQKNVHMGVWSGRNAYLWVGPTKGTEGAFATIDVVDLKRLLRKAGHL